MNWFCLNCESVILPDTHGRCPRCQSDALAPSERMSAWEKPDAEESWLRRVIEEAHK
jgi:hypothetical protein